MAAANVCGCGVCKANVADKTIKQSQFNISAEPKTVTLKIPGRCGNDKI